MTSQQRSAVRLISYFPENWKRQPPLKLGFFICAQNPSTI